MGQQETVSAKEYQRRALEAHLGGKLPRRTAASNYINVGRGFREIGDQRIYFRSRYEANYARYLEWLRARGDVTEWSYEPEEFWFPLRRGTRSYKPDFRVVWVDGTVSYVEVKGWMDPKSALRLKRMARYHPGVKVVVVGRKEHAELAAKIGKAIPGWESGERR